MQSLSARPPDFISSPHCVLMSDAQILPSEAAKAEGVSNSAAPSTATQVSVFILNILLSVWIGLTFGGQTAPSKTKLCQAYPNKIAWICLALFVRIGTFQWVRAKKIKEKFPAPFLFVAGPRARHARTGDLRA